MSSMSPTALNENHNKQRRCIDSRDDVYGFLKRDALRVMRVIGCPVVLSNRARRIDRLWMLVLTQDYETGLKLSVRYDAGSGQEREKREVRDVFVMVLAHIGSESRTDRCSRSPGCAYYASTNEYITVSRNTLLFLMNLKISISINSV